MNITSSQWNAEIARLVAENADPERISAARERRAIAERREEERETALLLERIEIRSGDYRRRGLLLDGEELRLLAAELRRLKGETAGRPSPYHPQVKGKAERAHRRQTEGASA